MLEFFRLLFDSSDFPDRWHCGSWSPGLGWLHIISDLVIFGCYVTIPIILIWFRQRRGDIPYPRVFTLFSVFILSCGSVHAVEALIFFDPVYRLLGLLKAVTAVSSLATVAYLVPIVPKLFALRSPRELEREIEQRKQAEAELKALQKDLERQVEERSRDLLHERGRLREALRRIQHSEALLSTAIDAAPSAMALVDGEGKIRLHNREFVELFGYAQEELAAMHVDDFLPVELRAGHARHRSGYLEAPAKRPMGADASLEGLHKLGQRVPLEIGLNPVEFYGESLILVAIVDISERVRAREALAAREETLRRANHELSEFVYAASHDLQEPLRKVSSFCQLLELEVGDQLGAPAKEYIGYAVDGTQRMQRLIRDLLAYAKVTQGPEDVTSLDVRQLVDEVIDEASVCVREAEPVFRIGELPVVHAQEHLLRQVFANLITNAIKYRRHDRALEIGINASVKSNEARFVVSDNGIGIPIEQRERVFRVFQRLHRKEDIPGSGVGLAVVKKAVERGGGRVWLEETYGGGVSVHFTVPRSRSASGGP
jgi:PAS domain S-box-containing protein